MDVAGIDWAQVQDLVRESQGMSAPKKLLALVEG
jgi:hypothetical protein